MMLQLKVIWHLFNLCAIGFAWTAQGSAGPAIQPPLPSHLFESSPPGPENIQPFAPQLSQQPPSTATTISPNQSTVVPSTKDSTELPSSAPTRTRVPSHDSTSQQSAASPKLLDSLPPELSFHKLAPQKPTEAHAPLSAVFPHHKLTPLPPVVPPYASAPPQPVHDSGPASGVVPSATTPPSPSFHESPPAISPSISSLPRRAHAPLSAVMPPHSLTPLQPSVPAATSPHSSVPFPPDTPSHVFASPPHTLVSQPTSATAPPSPAFHVSASSPPSISPSILSLPLPVLPVHSYAAPPPLHSGYASPPSIVAMPSHTIPALSPNVFSSSPHLVSPSPLLEVMPSAVPSATPRNHVPSRSSALPPQAIPSDVTAPHSSPTPPITIPSHVLVPPPTYTPNVSAPPPNSNITNHPSLQSPLPAPTIASNSPPIVLSPLPEAAPLHVLAPPPNYTPYISAPPPNATISEHASAPSSPPPPKNASNSRPHVMPPMTSSSPPDAAPSHDSASSPPTESHFSAPSPNASVSQHSSATPPFSPPTQASIPPPDAIPPIVSSPPSHDLAPSPPAETRFSAPPPIASISEHPSAPSPFTPPTIASNPPPGAVPPMVSSPPPDAVPSHDLPPSPPAESRFSAPPPSSRHNPPTNSPVSKNASYPPSASVSSHASAPSTTAEPPLTASPPFIHALPSESVPPVTSSSSAPVTAPPLRSPSTIPVLPTEPPSIPPEAQLRHVSSPAPSVDQRGDRAPVPVAPSRPTYPLSPTNDPPEQGFSPSIAPSVHKSRGRPSLAPVAPISPPISPTAEAAHSPSISPLPSTNKTHNQRDTSHSAPETSYTVPSPAPKQQGDVESPHSLLAPASERSQRYHPPTSHNPGSLEAMAPSQSPLTEDFISPAAKSGHSMTSFLPPNISPSPMEPYIVLAPPILALPPPPPNQDCLSYTCLEPYTNTIPGSPCGCVLPMKVELRIGVALYTFFPLVPELAREIATGNFIKQSQVRIMGANAASEQPDKTLLLIDLVPLGDKFDNITAFLIFERFWNKQVAISKSLFGDYEILYVQYPGLPASPPMAPSDIAAINGGDFPEDSGSKIHPLGVDVTKQGHRHTLSGSIIAIIVFSALGSVLLCLLLGWILLFRHRRHAIQSSEAPQVYPSSIARSIGPTGQSAGSRPSFSLSFESSVAAYTGTAKTFSAVEIEKATDNFNPTRVLGEGGFGLVYSASLEDGTEVAVKVLKREDQQGGREFLAEIEMLSRLHHRNLVKLIGICAEDHIRCLIYELIPNGSVESHLHGIDKQNSPLDWDTRMKIALGAARGLAYLHEDSSPRVIHRDFKASNILLEADFTPKVSDFGLARTAMDEENMHISTRVMGTFGYVAPEYAMTGHLLVKSDVYSYGVVLLELLTGRKPVDMSQPPGQENLVSWTRPYLTTKEALRSIIDPNLGPDISFDNVAKVAAIASMCVQPEVSHRPFMGEVVQALKLVCNNDTQDELGESPKSENLYNEARDRDVEKALSVSDVEPDLGCKESGSESFRRYSSSGPIGGGRSWRFWKRGRTTSSREDDVGENGLYRFWSGSH